MKNRSIINNEIDRRIELLVTPEKQGILSHQSFSAITINNLTAISYVINYQPGLVSLDLLRERQQ